MYHDHAIESLALTSEVLAGVGYPDDVYVWELRSGQLIQHFSDAVGFRRTIAVDPSSIVVRTIAKEEDGVAYYLGVESGN